MDQWSTAMWVKKLLTNRWPNREHIIINLQTVSIKFPIHTYASSRAEGNMRLLNICELWKPGFSGSDLGNLEIWGLGALGDHPELYFWGSSSAVFRCGAHISGFQRKAIQILSQNYTSGLETTNWIPFCLPWPIIIGLYLFAGRELVPGLPMAPARISD
jgi:hypothetical protein